MILDQYGRQIQWRAAAGADRTSGVRPWEPVQISDIGKLIPSCDRLTLLSASRRLFINHFFAGAIEQKAMFSVGRSWSPVYSGADSEWGKRATDWLSNEWYGVCDVKGGMHDFRTGLYLDSVAIDRDGDAFTLLTETETGYPRLQKIPCHRVANPNGMGDGELKFGPYRGLKIQDGLVYGKAGNPVACAFLTEEGEVSDWLSFRDAIHLYDPTWQEQGRGLPALTRAINDLRDGLQSHVWERQNQLACSAISLIEKNDLGGPDPNDSAMILAGDSCAGNSSGVSMEAYSGGMIRYFKSNSGNGLETLLNPRPGEDWENYQDRIVRAACCGIGWIYSWWKPSGQGMAERAELGRAQRSVEDRQDVLEYGARREVQYAIAKAMQIGLLPKSSDWWKWTFTKPAKLTIDDGRVSKELLDQWRAGWRNDSEVIGMLGSQLSIDDHYAQRAEQVAKRKLAARAASEKYGVEIEDREMAMLTANEPAKPDEPDTPEKPDTEDDANKPDPD